MDQEAIDFVFSYLRLMVDGPSSTLDQVLQLSKEAFSFGSSSDFRSKLLQLMPVSLCHYLTPYHYYP
jgi:hypothetical protein